MRPPSVKLHFSFQTCRGVLPSGVNRNSGFLKLEASICLERASIRPWPQAIGEELKGSEEETILTEIQ